MQLSMQSSSQGFMTEADLPRSTAHRCLDLIHYASCVAFARSACVRRRENVLLGTGHGDGSLLRGMGRHRAASLRTLSLDVQAADLDNARQQMLGTRFVAGLGERGDKHCPFGQLLPCYGDDIRSCASHKSWGAFLVVPELPQ